MELYKEILAEYLSNQEMSVTFPGLKLDAKEIVELQCYKALKKIKEILESEIMDEECFTKIENIILEFEKIGSGCANRHDFG